MVVTYWIDRVAMHGIYDWWITFTLSREQINTCISSIEFASSSSKSFLQDFLILERMFRSRLLANAHMILHRGNATTVVLMKSRGGADEDTVVRSRGPHVWRTRRLAYSSKRPCVRAQAKQTAARASPGLGWQTLPKNVAGRPAGHSQRPAVNPKVGECKTRPKSI
jgi:hypothetical protein